ncbi:MAG TPA: prolyl-tRNA synthetase associated domain-containing protein [Mobilitalea sp.]|nr:prolyl-tRNA synthetase associated domain-containing protein [Mobilitalea sp.]
MSTIYIDRTLYDAKLTDGKRIEKELTAYDLLEKLDIPYVRVDHGAADTIEDCEEVDALLGTHMCKNLFLCNASKTDFYLLLMPGTKKFVTKDLSKQLGCSRLSFASYDYMEQLLNFTPGSVTVLGLMYDTAHRVKLLIDKEVADEEYLGCHPCINTSSLRIKTSDIFDKFLPYTGHEPVVVEL